MTTRDRDDLFRRYLGILGWVGDPGLHELVSSHLIKVPYENVSLLLAPPESAGTLPTIEAFLDRIAEQDLGGTGFPIALHFAELLRWLDYEVELLAADVGGVPRSHAIIRVKLEDTTYMIDVGYAAPFYQPIALDQLPHKVPHGDFTFMIDRHATGAASVEVATFRGPSRVQTYVAKPPALGPDGFNNGVQRVADANGRLMRSLQISRFFASRVLEVIDNSLVVTHHNITTVTPIASVDELEVIVREQLQLPRVPVREAVEALRARGVVLFG
ncbi:MAG: arylamine N-acetyltransferase [Myxococcales bacterium]|nr:arylamine N-acetyltransferase [Myxococcales bacterium]